MDPAITPIPPDFANVVFKEVQGLELKLDLYLPHMPEAKEEAPWVVWLSGGGWKHMGKGGAGRLAGWLVDHGIAVVGVEYRVSGQAVFPAQIEDVRDAVRWVRAHAADYGLHPWLTGIWGDSAGGHLAALHGVTAEADLAVRAVCAFFPPCEMDHLDDFGDNREIPLLFGGPLKEKLDLAREASPLHHVHAGAPPHFLAHGDEDKTVPIGQSLRYFTTLREAEVPCALEVLPGAGHNAPFYTAPETRAHVLAFFERCLLGA
ncbi:MAG: alpha/beta hydrolase [Verrucomicrobia bacterium]|nr:alpha/beta hydrolase [Verrucomicrobiota bacterium]MCH8511610.1 alpha/beta hydrolase [Kiritimatiellia bacterium]